MAGRSRKIDPVTGDYVETVAGNGVETTTTLETSVYLAVSIHRGEWWRDADAGSDVHLARRRGLNRDGVTFARNAFLVALERFVRDGRARDASVELAVDPATGRILVEAELTEARGGTLDVSGLARFGGGV